MTPKKKRSLKSRYLQNWLLPPAVFIASIFLSIFLTAALADPVLKDGAGIIVMLPPTAASLGILFAAIINTKQKRNKLGAVNAIAFILSAAILIPIGLGLALTGMSAY